MIQYIQFDIKQYKDKQIILLIITFLNQNSQLYKYIYIVFIQSLIKQFPDMIHSSDLLVWGNNQLNLLSKSPSKCFSTPMPLCLPYNITSICASQKHISFITKQGQLYSYGSNLDGRLGISTKSIQYASYLEPIKIQINGRVIRAQSGFSHMCVLTDRMQLYSWGLGDYGALGTGQFKSRSIPTRVDISRQLILKLKQISCGAMHTAFLTQDGDVYACGSNQYGELGVNKPQKVSTPMPISFHLPVQQVSCGVFYTLLLTRQGRVYGMGNNKYGQLGTGHKVNQCHPTLIRQINDIVKVTAGYHSGAIDKFGNLYIWGSGSFGQLLKPKKFVLSIPIRDIAIRGFFGIAIGHTSKNQNRIYCWGNNTYGELGMGNYQAVKQPQQLQILRGLQINKVALGVNFAIVLLYQPNQYRQYQDQRIYNRQENIYGSGQQFYDNNRGYSERSQIKGFQERYLNSNTNKKNNNQQFIYSSTSRNNRNYTGQRNININQRQLLYDRPQSRTGSVSINKSKIQKSPINSIQNTNTHNLQSNNRNTNINKSRNQKYSNKPIGQDYYYSQQNTQRKDYQQLFLDLSQDYQILTKKYNQLQKQLSLSIVKNIDKDTVDIMKQRQKQLFTQNIALKQQISKLSYELIVANDQIRMRNRKNQQLNYENQKIIFQKGRASLPVQSKSLPLSSELEQQYNKLLTQKQQIIAKLNLSISKAQQQYKLSLTRLTQQNASLKNQLNVQIQNSRRIIHEHQSLIDQLQIQIKKTSQLNHLLKQQNQSLRLENTNSNAKTLHLQQILDKNKDIQTRQIFIKEQYQKNVKDSQLCNQMMTNRIAQLQVQLKYQRDFNQKYQQSISEIKRSNQKLHQQLNLQISISSQKDTKILNLKSQLQNSKKYKKQLDQKNIQLEQFIQNLENYKKKAKQIIEEKQKQIVSEQQNIQRLNKQFEDKLEKKNDDLEDLFKENTRLQKEINKLKQNVLYLKTQISLKDDQLQHMNQQKVTMQKKINRLTEQMNKQSQERDNFAKDNGQAKRQLAKLKITNADLQSKLSIEAEQKSNYIRLNNQKNQEITALKQQIKNLTNHTDNLSKQNKLYREQIQQVGYQLETQTKINQQLSKANRQFAESQTQFTQKINQLQNRIYQLQDQNKSYTPRYQALMIRNKQLDQRNRELGQMINKAIQMQAQSYKNNILKEVQINTDNIITQMKQEKQFQTKNRRNKNISKQVIRSNEEQQNNLTRRGQPSSIIVTKQQPYSKLMKQRISQHKRKVSQSAQKLFNILEFNQNNDKSEYKGFPSIRSNTEDYQKINSQMQQFSSKKQEFIEKIHSFAQKLKII